MHVPFVDLAAQNALVRDELDAALRGVVDRAQFVLGPPVEEFERQFAEYVGAREAIGVANGTVALELALAGLGIGPGDEVITTPHTWISTSSAISRVGARPVFVDIDPVTYNLDPNRVSAAITPRTRAILPVHLYGQMADVATLAELAARHGLMLVEDAAQAHGARRGATRAGAVGRAGCFSFYPGKNLGALGEGGAIVTSDAELANKLRRRRNHGQREKHVHVDLGCNARMESLQAAVLSVKLRRLDEWNARRRDAAERYDEKLRGVPGLTVPALPAAGDRASHVWHLYVVRIETLARDEFCRRLARRGVATQIHYPTPVPYQPCYASLGHRPGDFPVAERVMARCVSLPMFETITDEQIDYVGAAVSEALSEAVSEAPAE